MQKKITSFMTLIANWVAMDDNKDGKKPASLYLASDSRITYFNKNGTPVKYEDDVQKIFVSMCRPEMFAISGDYNSCVRIVSSLIREIDEGSFALENKSINEKVKLIKDYFTTHFTQLEYNSVILYGTKVVQDLYLYRFIIEKKGVVNEEIVPLGKDSGIVSRDGSGEADFFEKWLSFYSNSQAFNEASTSRGAFGCIYDAIGASKDPFVGGKMQAAAIYRGHDVPHPIGIYYGSDCYLFGKKIEAKKIMNIEFRNSEFEIVDPTTGKRAEGAQPQPFAKR